VPVLALAYVSRRFVLSHEGAFSRTVAVGKPLMGVLLLLVGLLTLSGGDRAIEARLVERMPDWLVDLVTRF
jgi:hypothetical protein